MHRDELDAGSRGVKRESDGVKPKHGVGERLRSRALDDGTYEPFCGLNLTAE